MSWIKSGGNDDSVTLSLGLSQGFVVGDDGQSSVRLTLRGSSN
jgi:hypothetical protein